jgi:tetratricopeptide (TPR) repeat protein
MKILSASRPCLTFEEIQEYLQGNLPPNKRLEIEDFLLECSLCAEAVEGYRNSGSLKDEKRSLDKLQAKVAKMADEQPAHTPAFARVILPWLPYAAAILILGILSTSVFLYRKATFNERLFADYRSDVAEELTITRRGTNNSLENAPDKEFQSFIDAGNFEAAATSLEKLITENDENFFYHYSLGLVSLELNDLDEAKSQFATARINDPGLYEDATWQLALAELKSGNMDEARILLTELMQQGSNFYREKCQKLLDAIDQNL